MRHTVLLSALLATLGLACTDGDDGADSGPTVGDCSDPATWHADDDGDGFGAADDTRTACEQPDGFVDNGLDCDDGDDTVSPDSPELCDGLDNDCNDQVDDDPVDPVASYTDQDGDGYGDPDTEVIACLVASGAVRNDRDCDDDDDRVFPGATETCDLADQDCDALIDEGADGATEYHADEDQDGFGDASASTWACDEPPEGYTLDGSDCNDADGAINPDAFETCDGVWDEDCDGTVDEADALNTTTFYADQDNDGFGDATNTTQACTAPSGYGSDASDCDDSDASEFPGASWYADQDGDGYGDPDSETVCERGTPTDVATNDDCNDTDATVHPSAAELCDGQLNDCLGSGLPGDESDVDGDGWVACTLDSGGWDGAAISGGDDCDDSDATEAPGVTWYADVDGDGYGDASSSNSCERANSSDVTDATDCDDGDGGVSPGAAEVCDGADQDCDASTDEGVTTTYYSDADNDGYGTSSTTTQACSEPSGYASNSSDCDDGDSSVNPAGTEVCDGSIDEDCDNSVDEGVSSTYYRDNDGDTYGDATDSVTDCSAPASYVSDGTDCDDADSEINPAATEICDGADNDCDPSTSEDDMASWVSSAGAISDITASLTPAAGSLYASYTLSTAGELWLCDGSWPIELDIDRDASIRGVSGDRDAVVLDLLGQTRPITIDKNGIAVELVDLTLSDGFGYDDVVGAGTYSGGNVACNGTGTTLTLDNVIVEAGWAYYGGGIAVSGCAVTLSDVEVVDNYGYYDGGGIWLEGLSAVLTDTEVSGNFSNNYGGGISLWGYTGTTSLDMTDSLVTGNEATYYGGGLWAYGYGDTVDVRCSGSSSVNAGFTANTATRNGGGVQLYGSGATLDAQSCDFGTDTAGNANEPSSLDATLGVDYQLGDDITVQCDGSACGTLVEPAFGDTTSEFGTYDVAFWTLILASGDGYLHDFSYELRSADASCTVEHYVLSSSSTSAGSTWTYEWSSSQTLTKSNSFSDVNSGDIDLLVEGGLYYALVVATACSTSNLDVKYGYGMSSGTDVGLGAIQGGHYTGAGGYTSPGAYNSGATNSSGPQSYMWSGDVKVSQF